MGSIPTAPVFFISFYEFKKYVLYGAGALFIIRNGQGRLYSLTVSGKGGTKDEGTAFRARGHRQCSHRLFIKLNIPFNGRR